MYDLLYSKSNERAAAMSRRSFAYSEHLGDVSRHQAAAEKPAVVLGGGEPEVAVGLADRHGQVLPAPLHIGAGIEKCGAITAEADALGGGV